MIFFSPQALLVYFILTNYRNKKSSNTSIATKSASTITEDAADSSERKKPKPIDVKKTNTNKKKEEALPPPSGFPFSLSNLFQPSADASAEYVSNLQNIQNMMGEFSEVYDWIIAQSTHFNWSSESETTRILHLILFSSALLGIVLYIMPIHLIFLSLGLAVYGLNTRFSKHVLKELMPYLIQFGEQKSEECINWYVDLETRLQKQNELEEISVFENQRWWPMRGYLYEAGT
jgi:hypothetical protein